MKPVIAPPKCAKCAIPDVNPDTPLNKSNATAPTIKNFALIGIGNGKTINFILGNIKPKAMKTPIIAPDAPTTGIFST